MPSLFYCNLYGAIGDFYKYLFYHSLIYAFVGSFKKYLCRTYLCVSCLNVTGDNKSQSIWLEDSKHVPLTPEILFPHF